MTGRAHYLVLYALILSLLWVAWIIVFLPTRSVSFDKECTELQAAAATHEPEFMTQCLERMGKGPENAAVNLLLITCLALVLLSLGTLWRERSLLARSKRDSVPTTS